MNSWYCLEDENLDRDKLPLEFLELLDSVTNKRARVVIDAILEKGFVTTEEITLKGYEHAPRAARDVRELGIPLDTFRVTNSEGKKIAAYRFGELTQIRNNILQGRKTFPKLFKEKLANNNGCVCEVDQASYELRYLQIDHRIPYEVSGDTNDLIVEEYMLLCSSCNRAKSWSCEKCSNWLNDKDSEICQTCYWANPSEYDHIALRNVRRLDILFEGQSIDTHDELKKYAEEQGMSVQQYVLKLLDEN